MTTHTVEIPKALAVRSAADFSLAGLTLPPADEYVFDFSSLQHVRPFGILLSSTLIRGWRAQRLASRFRVRNIQGCPAASYLQHVGYFQAFGADVGNAPGQARETENVIPLTKLVRRDLEADAAQEGRPVQYLLDNIAHRFARILTRCDEGDIVEALAYSFAEILRNAVEHSTADEIWYIAQYWPSTKSAQIAILDEGIGIRTSLQSNRHIDASTDTRAILSALRPGVSGACGKSALAREGIYQNSGFGLYVTSSLGKEAGKFFVCSGRGGVLVREGQAEPELHGVNFSGTALCLELRLSDRVPWQKRLDAIVEVGQEIANASPEGRITRASQATRRFRRGY